MSIFVGTFKYNDKTFVITEDFGEDYPADSAEWMFTEGNYACDCNRSLFIRRQHGKDAIPQLNCGDEIELIEYHVDERRY